ncbi:MAG: hypothetical protein AAFV53_02085 [Myxococcota bacterium]
MPERFTLRRATPNPGRGLCAFVVGLGIPFLLMWSFEMPGPPPLTPAEKERHQHEFQLLRRHTQRLSWYEPEITSLRAALEVDQLMIEKIPSSPYQTATVMKDVLTLIALSDRAHTRVETMKDALKGSGLEALSAMVTEPAIDIPDQITAHIVSEGIQAETPQLAAVITDALALPWKAWGDPFAHRDRLAERLQAQRRWEQHRWWLLFGTPFLGLLLGLLLNTLFNRRDVDVILEDAAIRIDGQRIPHAMLTEIRWATPAAIDVETEQQVIRIGPTPEALKEEMTALFNHLRRRVPSKAEQAAERAARENVWRQQHAIERALRDKPRP